MACTCTSFYPRVRPRDVVIAIGLLCILSLFTPFWQYPDSLRPSYSIPAISSGGAHHFDSEIRFWWALQTLFEKTAPGTPPPEVIAPSRAIDFDLKYGITQPNLLRVSEEDVNELQKAHYNFVNAIKAGDPKLDLVYKSGTQGIVTAAAGSDFPVLVISLRMIRRTGTTLPVEVYLKSGEEYEEAICEEVLPSLNARCIVMTDIVGSEEAPKITRHQLKSFALLFSSFEDVLWLDSDCFALHDPAQIFRSHLYRSTGLITWPDFSASTASPIYYEISSQGRSPALTERASTEAGQLFISKKRHHLTLLLMSYYNRYGPSHYYPLLTQAEDPDAGEQETFLAAASALGAPFYATSERIRLIGHRNPADNNNIAGSATVQFDPVRDHQLTGAGKWRAKNESVAPLPRAFFIHTHHPSKFNPATIFDFQDPSSGESPTRGPDGKNSRAWTAPEETIHSLGYDVENHFWQEVKVVACELEFKFQSWKNKWGICEHVMNYWHSVFEGVVH
ncbi:hypothetical protein VTN00DRAFT_9271 [Thermoascus crustaceus]|uniref:uncharacterized protein n=1 Tax=Thermoascus crustaceus TaxID=5088 RepID=UPI0037434738